MKVAAIVAADENTVMSLAHGEKIRIRDTETNKETTMLNPAQNVTGHRRAAVVKALLEQGVEAVITPPAAFCAHSYALATANGLSFWRVPVSASWSDVWNDAGQLNNVLTKSLPKEELANHQHHDGDHHH